MSQTAYLVLRDAAEVLQWDYAAMMIAAQLYTSALKDEAEIAPGIPLGNFKPLTKWLNKNVHSLGSSLSVDKMVEQATGSPLGAETFITHLKTRYLA